MVGFAIVKLRILTALLLAGSIAACTANAPAPQATESESAPVVEDIPVSPVEAAFNLLRKQAAAMLADDEAGWLAAVDPGQPALQARYRTMFATLHALDVSQFVYTPHLLNDPTEPVLKIDAQVSYCFSMGLCPLYGSLNTDAPSVRQTLTLKSVGGKLAITALADSKETSSLEPTPWENTALTFRQGDRVTVAATASEATHLDDVLAVAESAAKLNDRIAGYMQNPQKRYRIYLADAKAWRTWYAGETDKWVVGYSINLNADGADVVLNMPALLGDRKLLVTTVKHEMGHVVTHSGVNGRGRGDMWLTEGIAEYIGWSPVTATGSWRRPSVHATVHSSRRPTSIALPPPAKDASDQKMDAFYGLSHFAMSCLAGKYGERALFDFVRYRMQNGFEYDDAARRAFHQPFATVDKACVAWIRAKA
ncbi:hypothetical protein [Paractinoplanes durhamensis]|uniref:Peptidase MA-like domain-containing protein n=1 Tax=Paractinoplanes durhamensis TaxID=113563 RepID=A0ABQ3YTT2_9ACTN|nr:hypothetical protein [Actinoplanes durhamensis]GIE01022.1 hypothetical protein Adu01nite_23720 [Actinoplanes durhamensis]